MARAIVPHRADETAFAAFLQEKRLHALHFLRRLCGDDAEDVLQETLAKVWRLRASFDPARNGEAWLLQAAFRTFCDHRVRRRRAPVAEAIGETPSPHEPCRLELRDEVQHRLAALAPIERALLLGFHAHGMSLRELADHHGLLLNTVKSHLHRARARLLEQQEQEDEPR